MSLPAPNARADSRVFLSVCRRTLPLNPEAVMPVRRWALSAILLSLVRPATTQVWAGTGEEDSRNTISPGCGIFKSTDGGLTWKLAGLEKSGAIGRIVVHPTNPNIVYVAALGQAWAANPERGLYKTTDGGQTWQLVKFISDKAGFIDIAMDPTNPEVLFASSWERVRGPYFLKSGGR